MSIADYTCPYCGREHHPDVFAAVGCPFGGRPPKPRATPRTAPPLSASEQLQLMQQHAKVAHACRVREQAEAAMRGEWAWAKTRTALDEVLAAHRQELADARAAAQAAIHDVLDGYRVVEAHEDRERVRALRQRLSDRP